MNSIDLEMQRQKEIVKTLMPNLENLNENQMQSIIKKYVAAIEPNCVYWFSAAATSANSLEARYACSENLHTEIKDDHRLMLREFSNQIDCMPNKEDYLTVKKEVEDINQIISKMDGTTNVALMAFLENTSEVFIPVLQNMAIKLRAKDLTYTKVHGIADIEHARQSNWALEKESKTNNANYEIIYILGQKLISKIFQISN